ncbi:hypothetical protein L211DRAFT_845290 [Terfezia boudieri ATCC MYA-4762]|uniref:Uncharacterized protein n=1 Tax=Terfezia boudieri ATCC MYA-4762 TaxID=1051890 RepID=A0A3N4LZ26_9PEZI|nr:hypothetical protein L211DRAFT_845290 [Terfezia boudieri ATCC MYA-4762]
MSTTVFIKCVVDAASTTDFPYAAGALTRRGRCTHKTRPALTRRGRCTHKTWPALTRRGRCTHKTWPVMSTTVFIKCVVDAASTTDFPFFIKCVVDAASTTDFPYAAGALTRRGRCTHKTRPALTRRGRCTHKTRPALTRRGRCTHKTWPVMSTTVFIKCVVDAASTTDFPYGGIVQSLNVPSFYVGWLSSYYGLEIYGFIFGLPGSYFLAPLPEITSFKNLYKLIFPSLVGTLTSGAEHSRGRCRTLTWPVQNTHVRRRTLTWPAQKYMASADVAKLSQSLMPTYLSHSPIPTYLSHKHPCQYTSLPLYNHSEFRMAAPIPKRRISQPIQLSLAATRTKRARTAVQVIPTMIDSEGYVNDTTLESFMPSDMAKWLPKVYIDLLVASQNAEEWRGKLFWLTAMVWHKVHCISDPFMDELLQVVRPARDGIIDITSEKQTLKDYVFDLQNIFCDVLIGLSQMWIQGSAGKLFRDTLHKDHAKKKAITRLTVFAVEDWFELRTKDYYAIWSPVAFVTDGLL